MLFYNWGKGKVGSKNGAGGKKSHPTRGKRYSTALKKENFIFAQENDVASASVKYGVTVGGDG